jgi:hypothetical protein
MYSRVRPHSEYDGHDPQTLDGWVRTACLSKLSPITDKRPAETCGALKHLSSEKLNDSSDDEGSHQLDVGDKVLAKFYAGSKKAPPYTKEYKNKRFPGKPSPDPRTLARIRAPPPGRAFPVW